MGFPGHGRFGQGVTRWNVPLGSTADLFSNAAQVIRGTPNLGGAIATAAGPVFVGAAMDDGLRVFDVETGASSPPAVTASSAPGSATRWLPSPCVELPIPRDSMLLAGSAIFCSLLNRFNSLFDRLGNWADSFPR